MDAVSKQLRNLGIAWAGYTGVMAAFFLLVGAWPGTVIFVALSALFGLMICLVLISILLYVIVSVRIDERTEFL